MNPKCGSCGLANDPAFEPAVFTYKVDTQGSDGTTFNANLCEGCATEYRQGGYWLRWMGPAVAVVVPAKVVA